MANNSKTSRLGKKYHSSQEHSKRIKIDPPLDPQTYDLLLELSTAYKMSISRIVAYILQGASKNWPYLIDEVNKIDQEINELSKANLVIEKLQDSKKILLQESGRKTKNILQKEG